MQKCQRECDRSGTLPGGLGDRSTAGRLPGRRQKLRGVPTLTLEEGEDGVQV